MLENDVYGMVEYLNSHQRWSNWRSDEGRSNRRKYSCIPDFILKHGRVFNVKAVPNPDLIGEVKMCYNNAFNVAISQNMKYVEGYAMSIIPVLHAWVLDGDGSAYEVTWPKVGLYYVGVTIDIGIVADVLSSPRSSNGVLDDWGAGFPILRGKYKVEGYNVKAD